MTIAFSLPICEAGPAFTGDWLDMARGMSSVSWAVVAVMFMMSAWSLGVMLDRWLLFRAARLQSRMFAPAAAGALREGRLDEALAAAERYRRSHLAKVVSAGLLEMQAHASAPVPARVPARRTEALRRALERAQALGMAELERGLGGLATIGSTAPFVGLFGTVVGIVNAFQAIARQHTTGIAAVAGGISEALIATAIGLFVAIPAVWMYNYFTGQVRRFSVEMDNSASELLDYFLRRAEEQEHGST